MGFEDGFNFSSQEWFEDKGVQGEQTTQATTKKWELEGGWVKTRVHLVCVATKVIMQMALNWESRDPSLSSATHALDDLGQDP